MAQRELAYQKICFLKHIELFRLIFQKVDSTKNTFDSHGSGVKNEIDYRILLKSFLFYACNNNIKQETKWSMKYILLDDT